ncbi:MAG: hypothetical protein A2X18_01705 [Bacteroidetes bacterium GWF2_40_14]|nr:MAG: hypothetical protein A2X18_01705 [Bacteroidetes bacterium GWF2_40_14]
MKKIFIYIILAGVIVNSSCAKFLEQSSQDLIRPTSVAHYTELLQGESYFKSFYQYGWFVDVMTDDIMTIDPMYQASVANTKAIYCRYAFQWDKDLENPEGTFVDQLFKHLYKNILAANTCLESLDKMTGTDDEKNVLKGQASFVRAYAYFVLANLYSKPYNKAVATDLCVPLITTTTPSLKSYPRATISEIWDLITGDIVAATDCLAKDTKVRTYYEINYKSALILASRIFLYKEDYAKVIEYGEKYMKISPVLKDITAVTITIKTSGANTPASFSYPSANQEIAFTFNPMTGSSSLGSYFYYTTESVGLTDVCIGVSSGITGALIDSYTATDKRKNYWFAPPSGLPGSILAKPAYAPGKACYYDGTRFSQNMRTGEVYMNLAEAYARSSSPNVVKSLEYLNSLRSKRIASYTSLTQSNFATTSELVNFIWGERRRELCFEEFHRWWDLRRTGQPSITHKWLNDTYVLAQNDAGYILNFPKAELDFNQLLVENTRPVRNKTN